MEHPCHQCSAAVEDGTAFCVHCGAPQIRVGGDSGVMGIAGQPDVLAQATPIPESAIQWSQALPSAALAGLIAAILMFIPLGAFGLGMIAAGVLGVLFYQRRNPGRNLSPAAGARLGVVSGVLGFGIFAVLSAVEMLIFHSGGQLRAALLQAVQQSSSRAASDPQVQQMLEYLKSPPGLALVMGLGLAVMLVIFLVLSTLGGALGAVLLRRRQKL
jgi:hypothetical protein